MANETLSGKIAVITGGSRGIGYAIATRFLAENMKVAICGSRQNSVDEALASLSPRNNVFGAEADVTKHNQVQRFIAAARAHFGRIDILINCAGISHRAPAADLDIAAWHETIAVNLHGSFYTMREVLPLFREQRAGDVINISSLSSTTGFAGGAAYNASKAGLNGLTSAAFLDHRYDNIRIMEILPGSTDTHFSSESSQNTAWKIAPADIAEVAVTMLSMPRHTTISRVEIKPSQPNR